MTTNVQPTQGNPLYYILLFIFVIASFLIHEAAHYLAGEMLGNDMGMSLNRAWPVSGEYVNPHDIIFVAASGPAITLLISILGMLWAIKGRALLGYGLVFFGFLMRLTAMYFSMSNPNDEAKVSLELGLGMWTVPGLVTGLLLIMLIVTSRSLKVSWLTHILSFIVINLGITAVVFGDQLRLFEIR